MSIDGDERILLDIGEPEQVLVNQELILSKRLLLPGLFSFVGQIQCWLTALVAINYL
jgi:hypothetical protein